jgi:hypothetical protein
VSGIDLHCHSTASDGALAPAALIAEYRRRGIHTLALTDHDTVGGIDEAMAAGQAEGVCVLPGIELSVSWNKHCIHVVGLGIDPAAQDLLCHLEVQRRLRDARAEEIARRLQCLGIPDTLAGARRLAQGQSIGRAHFAQYLVEAGHCPDRDSVFKRYLGSGGRAFVPAAWVPLAEGIGWILAAGGLAVLAHPARYSLSATGMRRLLEEFRAAGGQGLEVVNANNQESPAAAARQAIRHGLLASAGSDFHAPTCPWTAPERMAALPNTVTPIWTLPPLAQDVDMAQSG